MVGLSAATGASASTVPADRWATSSGNAGNAEVNAGETALTASSAPYVAFRWKLGVDAGIYEQGPVIVNGVAYMTSDWTITRAPSLLALSVKTGAVLWTLPIPPDLLPEHGMTVTGNRLLIGYRWGGPTYMHQATPGGVIAIDLSTRRIVWHSALPSENGSSTEALQPYSDGKQVYVSGAQNAVVAFRLSDGKLLWHVPAPQNPRENPPAIDGMAVTGGQVFVVDGEGLVAFDGLTGKRLWSSSVATGGPVAADGRIFVMTFSGVSEFSAAGCGKSVCSATWSTRIPHHTLPQYVFLMSADSASLFVTYNTQDGSTNGCYGTGYNSLARLSARTGQILWSARLGLGVRGVVHAGGLLWAIEDIAAGPCDYPYARLIAVSATSTTAPRALLQIPLPDYDLAGQQLAVAGGTVFYKAANILRGARIKGQ
ncbi:PQQ-like beta-propeller repeat protein [Amnibacterium sp. CER49]|uniref:PQQ-binding-like beta-propeller repeat protein n=1 Tax=Amnibacterium sp. CER49 TaxID=3039161 RepID=UPI00244BBDAF|nr:PQQ-like beta-propeller repeat protein [Amnibacterium sp. CER49]MDH2442391.1 PQQ-like beta-propeller repeat protein [Amnibacterium sp. CER49]